MFLHSKMSLNESSAVNAAAQIPAENDVARVPVTEQTPLLRGEAPEDQEDGEHLQEPNMKEVIVIMSSIWLGVFLAALGMFLFTVLEF